MQFFVLFFLILNFNLSYKVSYLFASSNNYNSNSVQGINDIMDKTVNSSNDDDDDVFDIQNNENASQNSDYISKIVNDILSVKPQKNYQIGLVLPLTGNYAAIGKVILDTLLLVIQNSKFIGKYEINIYNIAELNDKNYRNNIEFIRLINDNNDIIIGSIFANDTRKIIKELNEKTLFITLASDEKLIAKYDNLIVFNLSDNVKLKIFFNYLKENKKDFIAVLLPATKQGQVLNNKIKTLAIKNNINVVVSEFYQQNDKMSIDNAILKINRTYANTYLFDSNGNLIKNNIKTLTKNKNNINDLLQNDKFIKKTIYIDSIWFYANNDDFNDILQAFNDYKFFDKNIDFFTDSPVDYRMAINQQFLNNINLIGYDYNYISIFNKQFYSLYNYKPNMFSYLTHDIMSFVFYLTTKSEIDPDDIYFEQGLHGILDDFRFTRESRTERRIGIYHINFADNVDLIYKNDKFFE